MKSGLMTYTTLLLILFLFITACNNPGNPDKKIDIDSLKGQLPTAPITPPDTARQFDTGSTGRKQ